MLISIAPNVEWRGNQVGSARRQIPLTTAVQSMRQQIPILRLKRSTPDGIAGKACLTGAGVRAELILNAFSLGQRIGRDG